MLKSYPTKPCKHCGSTKHFPYKCYKNPKKRKPLKQHGKSHDKWLKARDKWFKKHPQDYYNCYLCGRSMPKSQTTLDHVIPRSNSPELRYDIRNLKPCCFSCNSDKGSMSLEKYKEVKNGRSKEEA